jgi:adenylate cyclase
MVAKPLGYRPSRKTPSLCATCVEASPPGGAKMPTGVMFADVRGFTASSEGADPSQVSSLLRRFYGCAESVLFPEAIIDKLIGDEVMALYLPYLEHRAGPVQELMLAQARELLTAVGYGSSEGPFVELGIGLDYGEAYVGNIGERDLYDFTAVGDVVNTASRLQGQAAGGEIVLSERVAAELREPVGERVELHLKGKPEPETAYRLVMDSAVAAQPAS